MIQPVLTAGPPGGTDRTMDVKQVIVIRRDLGMCRGKEIAQGAHAAMMWLTSRIGVPGDFSLVDFSDAERAWLRDCFRKVVCQVSDLDGLQAVMRAAVQAGLTAHAVLDSGLTEFHMKPTWTAVAVGPDWDDRIDPVIRDLKLY